MEPAEENPSSNTSLIPTSRMIFASVFTFGFFAFPLAVYSKQPLFKSFCMFHTRALGLDKKSSYQVIGLSFIMSLLYTSLYCPLYYFGLLKILNVQSLSELANFTRESAKNTYKKYPNMQKIDEQLSLEFDKVLDFECDSTEKYLQGKLREEFPLTNLGESKSES